MTRQIAVTVFEGDSYGPDWPSENAAAFLKWLSEKVGAIPEEFQDKAKIEIGGTEGPYGENLGNIVITYRRAETDFDIQERARISAQNIAKKETRERAEFNRLKAKYGD